MPSYLVLAFWQTRPGRRVDYSEELLRRWVFSPLTRQHSSFFRVTSMDGLERTVWASVARIVRFTYYGTPSLLRDLRGRSSENFLVGIMMSNSCHALPTRNRSGPTITGV